MKILITTIFNYPHEGGLSTHVMTLKKGLEQRGHTVDVLSFSNMNPIFRKVYAQAPGYILNKLKKGKGQFLNDRQKQKLLFSAITSIKDNYDVINSQDVFAANASIESGIPTVATVHGYYSFEAISRGALVENSEEDIAVQTIEKKAYQNAAKVVAVDKRISEYIKEKAKVEATVIRNFIDITAFQPERADTKEIRVKYKLPDNMNILFVPRRLTEKNGVIYPALALPKVLEKHPNTLLVYAGTGEQFEKIQEIVKQNNLERNVRMLGSVPHEDMIGLYAFSTIVIVPSVYSHGVEEATSISALEAMGSGSPVIAGAVGGLREIFEQEVDGILVKEKDTESLSNAIIKLIEQPELAKKLAKNARVKVEKHYSHLSAAEKFEQIYKEAISISNKLKK